MKKREEGREGKKRRQAANVQFHIVTMCLCPSERVLGMVLRRHSEVQGLDYIFYGYVCMDFY